MSRQTLLIGSNGTKSSASLAFMRGDGLVFSSTGKAGCVISVVGESQWARERIQNTEYLSRITETCSTAGAVTT